MRAEPTIGRRVVGSVRADELERHFRRPIYACSLDMRRLDRLLAHEAD